MKKIVYTRPDGGVSVVHPVPKARRRILVSEAVTEPVIEIRREKTGAIDAKGEAVIRERRIDKGDRLISPAVYRDETEEEFLARIAVKAVPPDATDMEIVDGTALPADRTHRTAWVKRNGRIEIDRELAAALKPA